MKQNRFNLKWTKQVRNDTRTHWLACVCAKGSTNCIPFSHFLYFPAKVAIVTSPPKTFLQSGNQGIVALFPGLEIEQRKDTTSKSAPLKGSGSDTHFIPAIILPRRPTESWNVKPEAFVALMLMQLRSEPRRQFLQGIAIMSPNIQVFRDHVRVPIVI